uniref:Uncharacterized protein n=1 Tax=Lepeophtheirus salmonis TaxID=72036 RepID=A0A0K2TZM9_LEPSM
MMKYCFYKRYILTDKMNAARASHRRKLLSDFKSRDNRIIFYSGEKQRTVDRLHNIHNGR